MSDIDEQPKQKRTCRFGCRRTLLLAIAGLVLLCLVVAGLSALSNLALPQTIEPTDQLSPLDKARLAETMHLKQELGEAVWPGWGEADIPVLIWDRHTSFLVGIDEMPAGWEEVQDDQFQGRSYFRQPTGEHQNFAVLIGERWTTSMATKLETDLFVREMIQDFLPAPLEPFVPYRLLIQPSEVQMSAVLHESFHVFQAEQAPARFEDAEQAYPAGDAYWTADEAMHEAWQTEIELLDQALATGSNDEAAELAGQFLQQRAARREKVGLSPELVAYERRFEWLEGLAKYLELAAWRQAAETTDYEYLPAIAADPDFKDYETFDRRWSQEISQMKRQASQEGDTRFYYSGMAQAVLLDRLSPDWKSQILDDGVWLEDLLRQVIEGTS